MDLTIVGSGIMGRGIAQVAIVHDYPVRLVDIDQNALNNAASEIKRRLDREVQKNRIDVNLQNKALSNLSLFTSLEEAVADTDITIECIPENLDLKQSLIQKVESIKPQIIASNTSSISISKLSEVSKYPERIIGMHFFNPPPVMKLVEVVIGENTSETVLSTIDELARNFGKEPIHVKDFPGFASSRLGVSLGLEAIRMVEQGVASPEDIDKAMTLGYRHPMGPLELTDYIGLDTRLSIAEYLLDSGISPSFEIPNLLRDMVSKGKLGRKSGEGFYKWKEGKKL